MHSITSAGRLSYWPFKISIISKQRASQCSNYRGNKIRVNRGNIGILIFFLVVERSKKSCADNVTEEQFEIVKILLEAGAKLDFGVEDIPPAAKRQQLGISFKADGNALPIIQNLIRKGTKKAQVRENIKQPFIAAIEANSPKVVEFLLAKGANVNIFNASFATALDLLDGFFKEHGNVTY
jgi:hypothetical protein